MSATPEQLAGPPSTDGTTRHTLRHREKREALLDAAARRFNQHGVRGAALGDIGAALGLGTTSVTYYFRRKEDLTAACMLRAIEVFTRLAHEAAGAADVASRIQHFARHQARLLADIESGAHPQLISFNEIRVLTGPTADRVFAAYVQLFRLIRALLRGEATSGLGADEINARTHLTLSVFNAFRSWAGRYEPEDYPSRAEHVADVLLYGLGTSGAGNLSVPPEVCLPEYANGDTASEFLRAAAHLINEQGFRGVSVEQIAASLNLTKGSFYHHLDTKHDLIVACFERSFEVLRAALRQASVDSGSGALRVHALTRSLMRYQFSNAGPLLRWSAVSAVSDSADREGVIRSIRRLQERMGGLLIDGMQDGSIRPLDQSVTSQYLLSAINSAVELLRWVRTANRSTVDALYVQPVLHGVLSVYPQPATRTDRTRQQAHV